MVADPVEAGAIDELPLPWDSVITFPAMGWAIGPWSLSVTVTVVLPPWATDVLEAVMDELDGVATGAAKVTAAVWVTDTDCCRWCRWPCRSPTRRWCR